MDRAPSATVEAIAINGFGGPEVFETVPIPLTPLGEGDVRIAVAATSVNPVDYKIRDGRGARLAGPFPVVLHPDCAGTVTEVGAAVSGLAPGDAVYTFANGLAGKPGALAQEIVVDARMVARKPERLTFAEAAALPLVTVTAWYALIHIAKVGPGRSVFIEGGTGGVGHVAVQLAKARGARVFAACGSDQKCALAQDLGAEKAFNYRTTPAEDAFAAAPGGAGYDVVFNTAGAPSIDHAVAVAGFGGLILDILGEFPKSPDPRFQGKWLTFSSLFAGRPILDPSVASDVGRILTEAAAMVEAGTLRPLLDPRRFTFEEVGAAHAYAEHENPTGKVVITRQQEVHA